MVLYTSIAVFLFSALALIAKSGFSVGAALLFFGSAVLLWKSPRVSLQKNDRTITRVLICYFLVSAAANLIHHAPLPEYDVPLRFLLAAPVLLLLLAYPPDSRAVWSGIVLGSILAGGFALWQNLVMGIPRANGFTNPIQYGNISALLGMLCLAGLEWMQSQRHPKLWFALLISGAGMGVLGAILTGSRGSWVSIPVCLLTLYVFHRKALNKRFAVATIAGILLIFAASYLIPRTGVQNRLGMVTTETEAYFDEGEAETSLGARLEMWRTGLMIFPERIWFGWGKEGYIQHAQELVKAGKIDPIVAQHTHLHNEYLDALVKRGVPGLLAVLALYFVPLLLFAKKMKTATRDTRPYAIAGVFLCLNYIGFGLTQAFLTHNDGVMMYAFLLVLMWAQLRRHEQEVNSFAASDPEPQKE